MDESGKGERCMTFWNGGLYRGVDGQSLVESSWYVGISHMDMVI